MQTSTKKRMIGGLVVVVLLAIFLPLFFYHPAGAADEDNSNPNLQIPDAPNSANRQVVYELPLQKPQVKKRVDDDRPLKDLYDRDDTTSMADLRSKAAKTNAVSARILKSEKAVAIVQQKKMEKAKQDSVVARIAREIGPNIKKPRGADEAELNSGNDELAQNQNENMGTHDRDAELLSANDDQTASQDGNPDPEATNVAEEPTAQKNSESQGDEPLGAAEAVARTLDAQNPPTQMPGEPEAKSNEAPPTTLTNQATGSGSNEVSNVGAEPVASQNPVAAVIPDQNKEPLTPNKGDEAQPESNLSPSNEVENTRDKSENKVLLQSNLNSVPEAWVLQLASFSDQNNAAHLMDEIKKMGIDVYTKNLNTSTGVLVQVYVGPYIKYEKIKILQQQLEQTLHLKGAIKQYIL